MNSMKEGQSMKTNWKLLLGLFLCCGLTVGFGVVGCGGGDSSTGGNTTPVLLTVTQSYSGLMENKTTWQLAALVTDSAGVPKANQRVDWSIIEGDNFGLLKTTSSTTQTNGIAWTTIDKKGVGTIRVKAAVFGYNASVIYTFSF